MDTTILIYALSRSDSEARRILSDGGIDYEDAYQYLKRFDNEPLKEGEKTTVHSDGLTIGRICEQSARIVEGNPTHRL